MDILRLIKKDHQEIASLFKKLREAKGNATTCEQILLQLKEELELHAYAEEQVFYPALEETEVAQVLADEAREDHELIGHLLDELSSIPKDNQDWSEHLDMLEENVEGHMELEESEIFEAARPLLDTSDAASLVELWHTAKQEQMARNAR